MGELLFTLNQPGHRDAAHKKLEEVLASGEHPAAECRDGHGFTEVWSGPAPSAREGQVSAADMLAERALANLDDATLDKLADRIAARMRPGTRGGPG